MTTKSDVAKSIDIRDEVCPMNMAKTKAALKKIEIGQVLETTLKTDEALRSVSRSVKDEGHKIIDIENIGDETYVLLIERKK